MQLSKSLMLLAALTTGVVARPEGQLRRDATPAKRGSDWTSTPSSGSYSTSGFGSNTGSGGNGVTYSGNVGNPYGSNIIEVSSSDASQYKYVVQLKGSDSADWSVAIWNKYGEDGKMDGWFGKACKTLTLSAGETKYLAFDDDTQGGFAAAEGTVPTSGSGAYAATWGEFDFGSTANGGSSGFDVSAIQVQGANMPVQGMKICDALGNTCSSITPNAASVDNAYTVSETDIGGIGGNLQKGPVRLAVSLDYSG